MSFHWVCPHCAHAATIQDQDMTVGNVTLSPTSKGNHIGIRYDYIRCPNKDCQNYELIVSHVPVFYNAQGRDRYGSPISTWRFFPRSKAQEFPAYVPEQIRNDYNEASLIAELSPKACATLARRCLQGILRDYWKVKPGKLANEIQQIKDKCDPLTWDAIEAVRKVGNIGAHMEADIDVIVNVEPAEADLLIGLIETVVKDWYIARAERKARLDAVVELAKNKGAAKQSAEPKE